MRVKRFFYPYVVQVLSLPVEQSRYYTVVELEEDAVTQPREEN